MFPTSYTQPPDMDEPTTPDPREQTVRVIPPLRLLPYRPLPARATDPVKQLDCADAVSILVERYGLSTVARSLLCELAAMGRQDIESVTLDHLAQGEERQ